LGNLTSLAELESNLANQEDLDKQMSKVSIKDEENAISQKKGSTLRPRYECEEV